MGDGQGRSARRRAVVATAVLVATVALILTSCSRPAPVVVTSAHVIETNASLPLDRTVRDAAKAQRLYDVVQAQPKFPPGPVSCSVNWSKAYKLTFYRDGASVSFAFVQPDGCRAIMLPKRDVRLSQDQFWEVFADALGVPVSDLSPQPVPDSGGSPAPTATPGQP